MFSHGEGRPGIFNNLSLLPTCALLCTASCSQHPSTSFVRLSATILL